MRLTYTAYNVITSTVAAIKQDQTEQIACQLRIKVEKSQLVNSGVFKITSGNVAKRLKMRQETHVTIRARKTAEAAFKQIAAQELQAKKRRMQE